MATLDTTRRPALEAASRALDLAIESVIAGKPRHPSGTVFVPSDIAGGRNRVVVVHPDGTEERVRDGRRELVIVLLLAGLIGWAISRRPFVLALLR